MKFNKERQKELFVYLACKGKKKEEFRVLYYDLFKYLDEMYGENCEFDPVWIDGQFVIYTLDDFKFENMDKIKERVENKIGITKEFLDDNGLKEIDFNDSKTLSLIYEEYGYGQADIDELIDDVAIAALDDCKISEVSDKKSDVDYYLVDSYKDPFEQ